jgi:hypothetical protein
LALLAETAGSPANQGTGSTAVAVVVAASAAAEVAAAVVAAGHPGPVAGEVAVTAGSFEPAAPADQSQPAGACPPGDGGQGPGRPGSRGWSAAAAASSAPSPSTSRKKR